jgi:hypothetical protein
MIAARSVGFFGVPYAGRSDARSECPDLFFYRVHAGFAHQAAAPYPEYKASASRRTISSIMSPTRRVKDQLG